MREARCGENDFKPQMDTDKQRAVSKSLAGILQLPAFRGFYSFMGLVIRKIRIQTCIAAGVLLALGGMLFLIVSKAGEIWAGFNLPQPLSIEVIFGIGPYGWLALSVVGSVSLALNDLNSRPSFLRKKMGSILLIEFSCAVVAVLWSFYTLLQHTMISIH
jgi:hypothetical protein